MKATPSVKNQRTALIVLGMHRSGTSALAGALSLLGASTPRSLMVPTRDNPKGYWESTALMTLHDKILRAAGSSWHDWGKFNPGWVDSPVAAQFADELEAVIASEYGDTPLFLVKDPRMCRLMPLWQQVMARLEIRPKVVLQLRKPLEVSRSLHMRDGFGPMQSQALWLRHVLEAEAATRGMVRSFSSYDELLADWRGLAARLEKELALNWPRWSATVEAEVDALLADDLRHVNRKEADVQKTGGLQDAWAEQTYRLMSIPGTMAATDQRARADRIMSEFDAACSMSLPVVREIESRLQERNKSLQAALAESAKALDARDAQHAAAEREQVGQASTLQARIDALSKQHQAAGQSLDAAQARIEALDSQCARLTEEKHELGASKALLTQQVQQFERKLEEAVASNGEVAQRLEAERLRAEESRRLLDASREGATAAHDQHLHEMEALRSTHSLQSDRLHAEIASLQEALDTRFSETRTLTEMVFSLEARVETTSNELEASRADFASASAQIADLRTKNEQQRRASAAAATHAAGLERRLQAMGEWSELEVASLHGVVEAQRVVIDRFNQWGHALLSARSLRLARLLHGRTTTEGIPALVSAHDQDDVELIRHSSYFNGAWYLQRYKDVKRRKMDPARHYLRYGAKEGRNPGPCFDTRGYLQRYPDVAASGMNPLVHYLRYGMQEARLTGASQRVDGE